MRKMIIGLTLILLVTILVGCQTKENIVPPKEIPLEEVAESFVQTLIDYSNIEDGSDSQTIEQARKIHQTFRGLTPLPLGHFEHFRDLYRGKIIGKDLQIVFEDDGVFEVKFEEPLNYPHRFKVKYEEGKHTVGYAITR